MRFAFIFVVALLFTACGGDAYDQKIPRDMETWKTNESFQKAVDTIQGEDKERLTRWMLRSAMGTALGGAIPDISIRDAIKNQEEFEKKAKEEAAQEAAAEAKAAEEAKALAEQIEKEQIAAAEKMNAVLTVSYLGSEFVASNFHKQIFDDHFLLSFAFKNKSTTTLSGFKGVVTFSDMFDETIKEIEVSLDQSIPAGEIFSGTLTVDYNQFNDEDKKFKSTNKDKMKVSWIPLVLIFEDGTKLEMPVQGS